MVVHLHIDGDPSIQINNLLRDIDYSLDLVIDGDIHGDVMGTYKQWKNMLSWEYCEVFIGDIHGNIDGDINGMSSGFNGNMNFHTWKLYEMTMALGFVRYPIADARPFSLDRGCSSIFLSLFYPFLGS